MSSGVAWHGIVNGKAIEDSPPPVCSGRAIFCPERHSHRSGNDSGGLRLAFERKR